MLTAEERYRLLEEVSELSERWEYQTVLHRLGEVPPAELEAEPELGCALAYAMYHLAKLDSAYALVEMLERSCASRGRDRLYCRRLLIKGNVKVDRGDLAAGESAYAEVLGLSTAANDARMVAASTMNLATVAWLRCDYGAALSSYERALAAYRSIADSYRLASCHHNLAMVYRELALFTESAQHFDQSRVIFSEVGGPYELAFNDYERAGLLHTRGDTSTAKLLATRAYETLRKLELPRELGEALRVLGIIHRGEGQYSRARAAFEEALRLARQTGVRLLEAEVLEELAVLQVESGGEAADAAVEQASALYEQMGASTRAARTRSRFAAAHRRT